MAYALSFALDLGTPGLTLRAALSAGGVIHTTLRDLTATFYANGQGGYEFLTSVIPDSYRGVIVFYTGTLAAAADFNGVVIQSIASINPQEVENTNVKSSTLSTSAALADFAVNVYSQHDSILAFGDPLLHIVPGTYEEGTAGAALGKLNLIPEGQGATVIPSPADDTDLCTVYLNAEDIENNLSEGLTVTFQLIGGPAHSERLLQIVELATLVTDNTGHGFVTLQRNDLLTPTTTHYRVNCSQLGLNNRRAVLTTSLFNLMDLVSA